jgi:WD40 repeat protein
MVLAGGHAAKINSICFDPSGQVLVSGGDDGAVVLWTLDSTPTAARLGQHDAPVTQVLVLPDGTAALSCSEDGSVRKWDLRRCQLIERACRRLNVEPKPYVESGERVDA